MWHSTSPPHRHTLKTYFFLYQISSVSYPIDEPEHSRTLLFVGYTRVLLAALSMHYMSYHPKYCTLAYVVSCLLDAVDGQAARALGQTSKFGAVLDMVTDRCGRLASSAAKPSTFTFGTDVPRRVCSAISPQRIQNGRFYSSF